MTLFTHRTADAVLDSKHLVGAILDFIQLEGAILEFRCCCCLCH